MTTTESLRFPQLRGMGYHVFFGVEKYFDEKKYISIDLHDSLLGVERIYMYKNIQEVETAIEYYNSHNLNIYFNRGTLCLDHKTGGKGIHRIIGFSMNDLLNMNNKNMSQQTIYGNPFEDILIFDHKDSSKNSTYTSINTQVMSEQFVDDLVLLDRPIN